MDEATISTGSTVIASPRQVSADVDDEAIILNFDEGVYYGLDNVGARIWDLLQQQRTVGELRDTLVTEYDVDPARCEADLRALLSDLRRAGLVDVVDAGSP